VHRFGFSRTHFPWLPSRSSAHFLSSEYSIGAKWLELLKEIMPGMTRAAVIRDAAISGGVGQFAARNSVRSTAP
jgi:putative tryptophan/tyrosine transport system substrate-binding protein